MSLTDRSDVCRDTGESLFKQRGTAMAMERLADFNDYMTEVRSSFKMEVVGPLFC